MGWRVREQLRRRAPAPCSKAPCRSLSAHRHLLDEMDVILSLASRAQLRATSVRRADLQIVGGVLVVRSDEEAHHALQELLGSLVVREERVPLDLTTRPAMLL